jgi:hypothetical protein
MERILDKNPNKIDQIITRLDISILSATSPFANVYEEFWYKALINKAFI